MIQATTDNNKDLLTPEKLSFTFMVFLLWTFVLLSRPQDVFAALVPLRPALTVSLFAAFCFLFKFMISGPYGGVSSARSRQTTLYLGLVVLMILGVPFASYSRGAFLFVFTDYLKVVLFYFVFVKMVDSIRKLETAIMIGCFGTGFYAVTAIIEGTMTGERLTFGKMHDPNDLAFFTLSFLPFNFLFISKARPFYQRMFSLVSIISSILVILLSGSRGGFLAFVVVIVFSILTKTRTLKHRYKVAMVVFGLLFLSFNIITIDFSRYKTITNIGGDYNVTSDFGRMRVWREGIKFMINNPLLGVGASCFDHTIGTMRAEQGKIPRWQTAHNSFILVGAETGVIGFVLFTLMNLNAFKIFWRIGRQSTSERLLKIGEMCKLGFVGQFVCIIFLSQSYSFYWIFYIALSCVIDRFIRSGNQAEMLSAETSLMSRPASRLPLRPLGKTTESPGYS